MLNHVVVMGRFTKDPELKRTANGTPVTSFSFAVERDRKDHDGNKVSDFFDIVAWKNTAEFICRYFCKGQLAVIEGNIQAREWTDKNENKRKSVEIIAENIYFAEKKQKESEETYTKINEANFEDNDEGFLPF